MAGHNNIFCRSAFLTSRLPLFKRPPQARRIDPWILRSAVPHDSRKQPLKETDRKDELHVEIFFPVAG